MSNRAGNLSLGVPRHLPAGEPAGDWVHQAACVGLAPDLFHPTRGEHAGHAQAVCASCPVRNECLNWALRTGQEFGIWGGLSEQARKRIRMAERTCPRCGSLFRPRRRDQRWCSAVCRDQGRTEGARR